MSARSASTDRQTPGGPLSHRIFLSPPDVGPVEREALLGAFDSNWIAPLGPEVDAFEADFAHTEVGYNYRMSNRLSAPGRQQPAFAGGDAAGGQVLAEPAGRRPWLPRVKLSGEAPASVSEQGNACLERGESIS